MRPSAAVRVLRRGDPQTDASVLIRVDVDTDRCLATGGGHCLMSVVRQPSATANPVPQEL